MSITMLKKAITYSIIFAYTFNLLTPTAHARMETGDEDQRFQAGLLQKVSADTSFARNEAERTLPTPRIDLTQKGESEIFKLKVRETQLDQKTGTSNCLFQWKHKGTLDSFAHFGTFAHPWQQFLELKFRKSSGLGVTCRPQVEDGKESFVPYNYVFNSSTNVTLNHLVTPGYIEVDQSQLLTTLFVEGQAGVCLQSQKEINNSYVHRFKPAHIRSNEHIILHAPGLNNMDSIISGKKIFGYFDKQNEDELNGCLSGDVENSNGRIRAEETLRLHGNASLNNYLGLIESKSDQVHLSAHGSFKNSQGMVKSYLDLELHAKGPIENSSGLIESQNERACVSTEGSLDNRFGGRVKSFKDLELTIKGQLDNWRGLIDSRREKLTLKAREISNVHGGQITSQGLLSLHSSGEIDNFDGFIESRANQVRLTSGGTLFNKYGGQVRGKKGLDLKVAGDIKNIFANLWSEEEITLEAKGVGRK